MNLIKKFQSAVITLLHPRPLISLFLVFFKQAIQFLLQIIVFWSCDSNSGPFENESLHMTTRPGFPTHYVPMPNGCYLFMQVPGYMPASSVQARSSILYHSGLRHLRVRQHRKVPRVPHGDGVLRVERIIERLDEHLQDRVLLRTDGSDGGRAIHHVQQVG